MHDFVGAFSLMKNGQKVGRDAWQGSGAWLQMQYLPIPNSDAKRLFIYYNNPKKKGLEPWSPSQSDITAEDWVIIPQ